ncbi:hypothetical protein CR513_47702, partial [Mucuna pruriens]
MEEAHKMRLVTLVGNMQEDDEHEIPVKKYSYSDSNSHQIPGTGGPGQRTVSGHYNIPGKDHGKPGPKGNA